jgi:predicted ferric reductase
MNVKNYFLIALLALVCLAPGMIWYQQTGDLGVYLSPEYASQVPSGQLVYVLSKLLGLYALSFIAWQLIATLSTRLGLGSLSWRGRTHRWFGTAVVSLAIAHMLLFVMAVSLRQGHLAWGLFLPDFRDFYHTHLTFGLLGLWTLLTVVGAGVVRHRKPRTPSRWLHKAYWVAIVLITLHSLAIGTESQSTAGLLFYGTLGGIVLVLFIAFLLNRFRQSRERMGYST